MITVQVALRKALGGPPSPFLAQSLGSAILCSVVTMLLLIPMAPAFMRPLADGGLLAEWDDMAPWLQVSFPQAA